MRNGRKSSKSFWDRRKELNKEFGYEEDLLRRIIE
jgi:hypothetical protein